MKYKEGDRVKIKSLDWYNKNKNKFGKVWTSGGQIPFDKYMSKWCDKVMTISDVRADHYTMIEDLKGYWTDEMIEGLVEEPVLSAPSITEGVFISEKEMKWVTEYVLPDGYIFKDENGNVINATKIVLEKKQKEYPKTYEECRDILKKQADVTYGYKKDVLHLFQKLLVCRDAYWKIAGDEMGLGKPWEPSDSDYITGRYCIFVHRGNIICATPAQDCVLTFPTPEIRDAFKKNFDPDIEICKELL